MIDRRKLAVLAATLIGALSIASCGKEERVHESWKTPEPDAIVDDSTLNSTIQSALKADPDVKHLDVKVEAHNGTVMLSGFADNQVQLDRVNMLTWMVDGVKKVDNKMSVRSGPAPTDG
ncbi:MAG TPA: BON domain-containing protein [Nitrosospira sp.]|jgi:hyperosmotically inducible protein|nr:BON domain-containing protein [Nitrosospira sp.]